MLQLHYAYFVSVICDCSLCCSLIIFLTIVTSANSSVLYRFLVFSNIELFDSLIKRFYIQSLENRPVLLNNVTSKQKQVHLILWRNGDTCSLSVLHLVTDIFKSGLLSKHSLF